MAHVQLEQPSVPVPDEAARLGLVEERYEEPVPAPVLAVELAPLPGRPRKRRQVFCCKVCRILLTAGAGVAVVPLFSFAHSAVDLLLQRLLGPSLLRSLERALAERHDAALALVAVVVVVAVEALDTPGQVALDTVLADEGAQRRHREPAALEHEQDQVARPGPFHEAFHEGRRAVAQEGLETRVEGPLEVVALALRDHGEVEYAGRFVAVLVVLRAAAGADVVNDEVFVALEVAVPSPAALQDLLGVEFVGHVVPALRGAGAAFGQLPPAQGAHPCQSPQGRYFVLPGRRRRAALKQDVVLAQGLKGLGVAHRDDAVDAGGRPALDVAGGPAQLGAEKVRLGQGLGGTAQDQDGRVIESGPGVAVFVVGVGSEVVGQGERLRRGLVVAAAIEALSAAGGVRRRLRLIGE